MDSIIVISTTTKRQVIDLTDRVNEYVRIKKIAKDFGVAVDDLLKEGIDLRFFFGYDTRAHLKIRFRAEGRNFVARGESEDEEYR